MKIDPIECLINALKHDKYNLIKKNSKSIINVPFSNDFKSKLNLT